jgi:hypothetical protein
MKELRGSVNLGIALTERLSSTAFGRAEETKEERERYGLTGAERPEPTSASN